MKDGTLNDPYLRFLRTQPCCICGTRRHVESAHFGPHAYGKKAPAKDALPICHTDHRTGDESLHALGPRKFVELHQLAIPALIAHYNQLGKRYLDSAHRPGRRQRSPEFFRYRCCCGWKSTWFRNEGDAKAALERHLDRGEVAA